MPIGFRSAFFYAVLVGWAVAGCMSPESRDNPRDPFYQGPRGIIEGRVILRSGTAITYAKGAASVNYAGVRVALPELPNMVTTTEQDGLFRLARIPVGIWALELSAPGYVTATIHAVRVSHNQTTVLDPVDLHERIAARLVFGSSRSGIPALYEADASGVDRRQLSHLPIQSDTCRYVERNGRKLLVVETSGFVFKDAGGRFSSSAGIAVLRYPSLELEALVDTEGRVRRPLLAPDGSILVEVEEGGDRFIAKIPPRAVGRIESFEPYRLTGRSDDEWTEYSPAMSQGGRLAYVRSDGENVEIRVWEGSDPGTLVLRRDLVRFALSLRGRPFLDFNDDGEDDTEKLLALGAGSSQGIIPPYFAGVDWTQPAPATDPVSLRAYILADNPSGIHFNLLLTAISLIQLAAISEIVWMPDERSLLFVDRSDSQPEVERTLLWPIVKQSGWLLDAYGQVVSHAVSGANTQYFFDMDGNRLWSPGRDKPFWYDDPASYQELLSIKVEAVEIQSLRKLDTRETNVYDSGELVYQGQVDEWLFAPAVSPDGKRVALQAGPAKTLVSALNLFPIMSQGNILTVDPANRYITRITTDGLDNRAPCWVPEAARAD